MSILTRAVCLSTLVLATAVPIASNAASVSYGFSCFRTPQDSAANCATGSQFGVTVSDAGGGQVSFLFTNTGPNASSIADVYFDDGTLLGIASIVNGAGVNFSQGASPGNLPGGANATPPFVTTQDFLADSNAPVSQNGVNPGETLTILFNLINGKTFDDTIAALAPGNGDLRIGIHVQAFSDGKSESFLNGPPKTPDPPPVPLPAAAWLLLSGLGGLGLLGRRRKAA